MRIASMKRGIHPPENKETALTPIKYFFPRNGAEMVYPMLQHIGAPCQPTVEVGDYVEVGQKVGDCAAAVSSPVHATVSGPVRDIRTVITPTGRRCVAVVMENDGKYRDHPACNQPVDYIQLPREKILAHIRECGIVGMGGAGFPTHVKLNPPPEKKIDTVIVNAAECEPYLTNDHRVMLEEPKRIMLGLEILLHLFPEARGVIAVENNKPDAIELLGKMIESPKVTVMAVKTRYPQGAEKQLIQTCMKREVPSGGFPMDVGCIVQNVDTVIALHRAFHRGRPLMRKIMTIAGGAVNNPGNYKVRFGMSYRDIIEAIGGLKCDPYKIIIGGPMMGVSHYTFDIPVIKTSSAFLLFTEKESKVHPERACFRCGKCVEHCPVGLMPLELNKFAIADHYDRFRDYNGLDCIECGCCSYICPAKRHLTQSISTIRRELLAARS
ncbi:MAG: electron transport complex subunit RsxC [Defluviitaleaceae bacterium]|nr:electron transport complex subunit RsxC [Defluviitaleaceae bacterium]MCL2239696.1 electron transport complex subunit RsxC [Defluviitaleaceae bacterium]